MRPPATWGQKKPRKREPASFTDEFWRYAEVHGIVYPVLLKSNLINTDYCEPIEEGDDYPWYCEFREALKERNKAVIVRDQSESSYVFESLNHISDASVSNNLTCVVGKELTRLYSASADKQAGCPRIP